MPPKRQPPKRKGKNPLPGLQFNHPVHLPIPKYKFHSDPRTEKMREEIWKAGHAAVEKFNHKLNKEIEQTDPFAEQAGEKKIVIEKEPERKKMEQHTKRKAPTLTERERAVNYDNPAVHRHRTHAFKRLIHCEKRIRHLMGKWDIERNRNPQLKKEIEKWKKEQERVFNSYNDFRARLGMDTISITKFRAAYLKLFPRDKR